MSWRTQAARRKKTILPLEKLRSRIAKVPPKPGVYRWLDAEGNVLYVGKAKNLRNRLRSYVQKKAAKSLGPWKRALREHIADFAITVTSTELEALILETNLIKELHPKYNVTMKDDKNYVYVRVTTEDLYPSVSVVRRMEDDDAKYFGPYLSAKETHRTLEMLHDLFRYRACRRSTEALNAGKPLAGTPCLERQIGRCNGLCTGDVTEETYREAIGQVMRFFRGDRRFVVERLNTLMQQAAVEKKFERAAKLRDTLEYVTSLEERQVVSDTSRGNADVFGVALRAGRAQVTLLKERDGKVINELSFPLQGNADRTAELLAQFLPQYYSATQDIPEIVLIGEPVEEQEALAEWLTEKQGAKVTIVVPERGKKSRLLALAEANAAEKVEQQFAKWEAETLRVETALRELQEALALLCAPKRIECYDISHLGGTETVGSMVAFIDGKPRSDLYRSFTLRTIRKGEIDDYKALREVLLRRLRHLRTEECWRDTGVVLRRARKADRAAIEEILERNADLFHERTLAAKDVIIVAEHEKDIVGFGRLVHRAGGIRLVKSVWVNDQWRGRKLGHRIIQKLLISAKKGKIYVTINPELEEYYAQLGFRYVQNIPSLIREETAKAREEDPSIPPDGFVMMCEVAKAKPDPSLTATPDLLVLDGGKGQLKVGLEALRTAKLPMPIVALAKQEEEVFIPDSPAPLPLRKDSEARFLLMRMRDEAHRFANRHRERRLKYAMTAS